jgi:hypothetical protein
MTSVDLDAKGHLVRSMGKYSHLSEDCDQSASQGMPSIFAGDYTCQFEVSLADKFRKYYL